MDTRSKILNAPPAALAEGPIVVTGYFDVLRVEHVRALEQVRLATPHRPVVVVVLPLSGELQHQRARAEMAAALRMVDYVLTADHEDAAALLEGLRPFEVVRLEASDLRQTRELIEHVQRGQTR